MEPGSGMPTGLTRPLCSAAIRQAPSSFTATSVWRESRRFGKWARQGMSTEPVACRSATSGLR